MAETRAQLIEAFVGATPWTEARQEPLAGDASFRRYVRLVGGPEPAMLMDAPPPQEDVRPFLKVAEHLAALGLSAPRIFHADAENGFLLLEDFGDATYTRELAAGASEDALYERATDTLIALHRHPEAAALDVPGYDAARYWGEARLLTDWYMPAVGLTADPDVVDSYRDLWGRLLPLAAGVPTTLVLRDYHVDNLMNLPDREGVRACGLLDFQDAVIGPTAYDFVSLVGDARRDVPHDLRVTMMGRYLAAFPDQDPEEFTAAAAMLSAGRNCKIIGIFTRLLIRDGKPVYLKHIPRVWRLLEEDIRHPSLQPLADWLDHHIPPERRVTPEAPGQSEDQSEPVRLS